MTIRFGRRNTTPSTYTAKKKVREKLTYIHENPVRAGLVVHTCDWAFSSGQYYEQRRNVGVPIQWIA